MNQSAVSAVAVPAASELAVKPQSLTGQIETFLGITVPFCGGGASAGSISAC